MFLLFYFLFFSEFHVHFTASTRRLNYKAECLNLQVDDLLRTMGLDNVAMRELKGHEKYDMIIGLLKELLPKEELYHIRQRWNQIKLENSMAERQRATFP